MTDQGTETKRGSGRWLKVLLGVSLAANFVFIGFVAGAALRHEGGFDRTARAPGLGTFGAPYILALDRQDRRAMFRVLRDARTNQLPDRATRRAMFEEVLDQLRAEPFDPAALRAAVDRQAGTAVAVQQKVQTAWLDVVTAMSDQDRRAYAFAVEEALRKGAGRR